MKVTYARPSYRATGVARMNVQARPTKITGLLVIPQHEDIVFHTYTEVGIQKTVYEKEASRGNTQRRKRFLKACEDDGSKG
jgi:hypothetical protein